MLIDNVKFSPVPSPSVSANYVHIDTNKFIESMAAEGFRATDVKFDKAVRRDPRFIRHMVTFEHEDISAFPRSDVRPRILFINSHNRTVRATVAAGLLRFACMNGCIIGDHMQGFSAKHLGDPARELIERARDLAKNTAPLFAQIERWERIELTEPEMDEFATRAALLRWGEDKAPSYSIRDLLSTRRAEDEGRSLWRVFNRIQENATRGGFEGRSAAGRRILARALSGITADTAFNRSLWELGAEVEAAHA